MKKILLILMVVILVSCRNEEFKNETYMYIGEKKVPLNKNILKVINKNDSHTVKTVIRDEPQYIIKVSDHTFKIYGKNHNVVQELKDNKSLYQYEITNEEFIEVDKEIKKLLQSD